MIGPTLIPLRVAALQIGYSPERVLRLITTHQLVGQPVRGRWLVDSADLQRFVDARAVSVHLGSPVMAGGGR